MRAPPDTAPRLRLRPGLLGPAEAVVWSTFRELDHTQWLSPADIEAGQLAQVRSLLRHALAHVPYYRSAFAGIDPDAIQTMDDFRRLPRLDRPTFRARHPELIAEQLPPNVAAAGEAATSGTTGLPIAIPICGRHHVMWLACHLRDLEWCGIDPRGSLAVFRVTLTTNAERLRALEVGASQPCWHPDLANVIEAGHSHHMNPRVDLDRQVDWLRRVRPDYILGLPSHLDLLAERFRASGSPFSLRAVQTMGELLSPTVRGRLAETFGCPVHDLYSCSEAGHLASPCPAGDGMHIHAENVLFEVLDEAGRPCPPGVSGRVVLTTLQNHRMPLIRCEVADSATLAPPGCPCGRGLPRLLHIGGKFRPWFRRPDGSRRGGADLEVMLNRVPGLLQFQVTQRSDGRFAVSAVGSQEWTADTEKDVHRVFEEFVGQPGWCDLTVTADIPRTAGGKVRPLVSEIDPEALPELPTESVDVPIVVDPPQRRVEWFHLLPALGGGWPKFPDPSAVNAWAMYRELDRTQWLSPEAHVERQLALIHHLVRHCVANVPHYRQAFAGVADAIRTLADFSRLPILDRRVVRETSAALLADVLPAGIQEVGKTSTSGSMGVPIEVRQTNLDQVYWLACYLRDLEWAGVDIRRPLAVIKPMPSASDELKRELAVGAVRPAWHPGLLQLLEFGPAHFLEARQPLEQQADWVRRVRPDYLLGYPTNLDLLAERLAQTGDVPRFQAVQTYAENLSDAVRERLSAAFGCRVSDIYSCSEAGYLASPCPAEHGMHVHAENVFVEIVDEAGQPCPPGEPGRVLLTALHNYRMPFVRYDIGDVAAWAAGPCPCGRGLPRLARIDGKVRPFFRRADGQPRTTAYLAVPLTKVPGLLQFQATQQTDGRVLLRVVPSRDWGPTSEAAVQKVADEFMGEPGWCDVTVVSAIERTAGGKVKDFIVEETPPPNSLPEAERGRKTEAASFSPSPLRGGGWGVGSSTVLLAWELGGGLGHIRPLARVAHALAEAGFRPVLASPNLVEVRPVSRYFPWPVLPAPRWTDPAHRVFPVSSYADVLGYHGYASLDALAALVRAWEGILSAVRPALVVADFAPTLCLAAAGSVPIVDIGGGYWQPPTHLPTFPPLRVTTPAKFAEPDLLATVNELQRRRGRPLAATLPEAIFAGATLCPTALPELDVYREHRVMPDVGPLEPLPTTMAMPKAARFFAYLDGSADITRKVLPLLAASGHHGEVYLRNGGDRLGDFHYHDRPPSLEEVFSRTRAVIHHGGVGTATAALAAGRPQLLLPRFTEQLLNADSLHRLGVAHYLVGEFPPADVAEAVRQLMHEGRFAIRASELAASVHRAWPGGALSVVVERCRAAIAGVGA